MHRLFQPGDKIYGFCNGYFGREDYKTKICISVRPQYAVFEYEDGSAAILNASEGSFLSEKQVQEWKKEPNSET